MSDEPLQEVSRHWSVKITGKLPDGSFYSEEYGNHGTEKTMDLFTTAEWRKEKGDALREELFDDVHAVRADIIGRMNDLKCTTFNVVLFDSHPPVNKEVCSACLGRGNAKDGELCPRCQGTGQPSPSSPVARDVKPKATAPAPESPRKPPQDEGLSVSHRLAEVGFVPAQDKEGLYYKRIGQEIAFADLRETTKYPYYATKEGAGFLHKKDMSNEVVKALEDAEQAVLGD